MLFLIAEPLRNLGRYTFADASRTGSARRPCGSRPRSGRCRSSVFYLIAQMVGAGTLINLIFGLPYAASVAIVGGVMLSCSCSAG